MKVGGLFYTLNLLGFHPEEFLHFFGCLPRFFSNYNEFRKKKTVVDEIRFLPVFCDFDKAAGSAGGHYFYQDLWAARKIFQKQPKAHVDVGSRIDGFIAHLLTFMPVKLIDIRPLPASVSGLTFIQGDATHLSGIPDNSIESLSSLHAIEHFGLGRYGDPIDPEACFTAMRSLARVLEPGGRLYFSVPVGHETIQFNARRIFSPATILDTFRDLELVSFSVIDDSGCFIENTNPDTCSDAQLSCGLFEFTKKIR